MPDLLDILRVQDPPPQELRPGYGIPRPGLDGVAETDSMGRPFDRSTLIRGPHQLASNDPLQAISEYEARVAAPRNDVFGNTLTEDTPAAMQQGLLAPFTMGLNAGMRALKPVVEKPKQIVKSDSTILERDPLDGQLKVAYAPPAKPTPIDLVTKSSAKQLEAEIGEKRRALLKEDDADKRHALAIDIQSQQFRLHRLLKPTVPPAGLPSVTPQNWQTDPSNIPTGAPKSFMIPPMRGSPLSPGASVPPMPSTQPRRLRYNPATGTLE